MTEDISWWTVGWIVWLLYFLILEGWALWNSGPHDTLSEHVWAWFGTRKDNANKDVTVWTRIRQFLLAGFMIWLTMHFIRGE